MRLSMQCSSKLWFKLLVHCCKYGQLLQCSRRKCDSGLAGGTRFLSVLVSILWRAASAVSVIFQVSFPLITGFTFSVPLTSIATAATGPCFSSMSSSQPDGKKIALLFPILQILRRIGIFSSRCINDVYTWLYYLLTLSVIITSC